MLVLAALADGGCRYGEISRRVSGISSNVLAARLSALGQAGLIVGEPYSTRPDRLRYELTAEGRALVDALAVLAASGSFDGDEDAALRHDACGGPLEARWYCPACGTDVEPGEAGHVFHA